MIAIKREALLQIVQQAMFLGQIQYMTMIKPERDRIKQREAQRYLENLGYSMIGEIWGLSTAVRMAAKTLLSTIP